MTVEPSTPRRRRLAFRLSVRALIVLVLLVGGGLGWWSHLARVQRRAVEAVRAAGGHVTYEWAVRFGPEASPQASRWRWLADGPGLDYLGRVDGLSFSIDRDSKLTDETLAEIGKLDHLRHLTINDYDRKVTDAGLAHLARLSRLERLELIFHDGRRGDLGFVERLTRLEGLLLAYFPVDDLDLAHVSKLERLQRLAICIHVGDGDAGRGKSARITDDGLKNLEGLRDLESIQLDGTEITTKGLVHLQGLTRLESLELNRTRVAGLGPLEPLVGLKSLAISDSLVDDEGLAPVAIFTRLESLNLQGTKVGDAGLARLSGLARLKFMDMARTRVTVEARKQAARAGLTIH